MSAYNVTSQISATQVKEIDREKVCPLLLRIFRASGRHNSTMDYERGDTPKNELQIYTWMDCTLQELGNLIRDVDPDARKKGTELRIAVVSPHPRQNRFVINEVGVIFSGERSGDEKKTLANINFAVGDYIDVAICSPNSFRNGNERRFSGGGGGGGFNDRPQHRRYERSFRD